MLDALTAVFVSLGVFLALAFLFRMERARGARLFAYAREHLDFWILKVSHALLRSYRSTWKNVMRQVARYIYHTLLLGVLELLERVERRIKDLMRSNRTSARKSERERTTRNKLEEVAIHKMEVALSDEEKRRHKEKSLHG